MGFGDDAIRIQVGVSSSVKAGMDNVVSEVNSGAAKISKAGGASGKGFSETFGKALRGDISGAFEDLQQKLGAQANNLSAKVAIMGAGIATALITGYKAGTKIDEATGASDIVSKVILGKGEWKEDLSDKLRQGWEWVKNTASTWGTEIDPILKMAVDRMKRVGDERRANEATVIDHGGGLHPDNSTPEEIAAAEAGRQEFLRNPGAFDLTAPTAAESAAYDKANLARIKRETEADNDRRGAAQRGADLERAMAEQAADANGGPVAAAAGNDARRLADAMAARRVLLNDAVARGDGAQGRIDSALSGREYKNVMAAEREQKRKDDREGKLADMALDNAGRRKLTKREEALLAGIGDKRAAEEAKKELAKMDAEAKKATIAAAASLKAIENDIKGVLVMKGN